MWCVTNHVEEVTRVTTSLQIKYQDQWKDKYDTEAEGMGVKRIHKCVNVHTVMVKDMEQNHAIQVEIN